MSSIKEQQAKTICFICDEIPCACVKVKAAPKKRITNLKLVVNNEPGAREPEQPGKNSDDQEGLAGPECSYVVPVASPPVVAPESSSRGKLSAAKAVPLPEIKAALHIVREVEHDAGADFRAAITALFMADMLDWRDMEEHAGSVEGVDNVQILGRIWRAQRRQFARDRTDEADRKRRADERNSSEMEYRRTFGTGTYKPVHAGGGSIREQFSSSK